MRLSVLFRSHMLLQTFSLTHLRILEKLSEARHTRDPKAVTQFHIILVKYSVGDQFLKSHVHFPQGHRPTP